LELPSESATDRRSFLRRHVWLVSRAYRCCCIELTGLIKWQCTSNIPCLHSLCCCCVTVLCLLLTILDHMLVRSAQLKGNSGVTGQYSLISSSHAQEHRLQQATAAKELHCMHSSCSTHTTRHWCHYKQQCGCWTNTCTKMSGRGAQGADGPTNVRVDRFKGGPGVTCTAEYADMHQVSRSTERKAEVNGTTADAFEHW
jgi:hypothetical protein